MTSSAEVTLSILDSRFRVASNDGRMVRFAAELWEAFADDGGGPDRHEVALDLRDGAWHLAMKDEPRVSARDPWVAASSLRNALSRRSIHEATSIVPLHAAAVERDGAVVVLSGPPKTGKTTLLLDLIAAGWLLVTDDLVPLDPGSLTATPFPKPLSVREPARWARFTGGWNPPEWLPPPEVVGLLPATALPHTTLERFAPAVLVFPRFEAGAEPVAERLTPAEAVAWSGDNLHSRSVETSGVLPALAGLGRRTPAWRLTYGSSDDAVDLLLNSLAASTSME